MLGRNPLTAEQVQHLQKEFGEWCRYNGLVMREGHPASITLTPGRFAVPNLSFYISVPKACVELAKSLAPVFNKLVHKICEDTKFLLQVHEHVPDDFTQRLAKIVKTIAEEGGDPQKIQMGIFRSDYMLHESCKLRPSVSIASVNLN
jgi:hypothetical protein